VIDRCMPKDIVDMYFLLKEGLLFYLDGLLKGLIR